MEFKEAVGICSSRKVITEPGEARVKVERVVTHNGRTWINIGAVNQYGASQARAFLIEAKEKEEAELMQKACNTGLSVNLPEGAEVPGKGKLIDVMFDNVKLKSGETALLARSFSIAPVKTDMSSNDLSDLLEEAIVEPQEIE